MYNSNAVPCVLDANLRELLNKLSDIAQNTDTSFIVALEDVHGNKTVVYNLTPQTSYGILAAMHRLEEAA